MATLCYVRQDNRTLMLHRVKRENDIHKGKWNGLGGKFERGETPEECVKREVYEESGLRILQPKLKGFLTFPLFSKGKDWYVFVFVAEQFEGKVKESCDEGELHWIENDKLYDLPLWEGDKTFLPWLDKDHLFSAKFIYKEGKLVESDVISYKQ